MRRIPWPGDPPYEIGREDVCFVADVHLADAEPAWIDRFCAFLESAADARLIILGDLFHLYWGPEMFDDPLWARLIEGLRARAGRGGAVFLPGNRDFNAAPELARRAQILTPGEVLCIRSGASLTYACHGDQLCLKDLAYQRMKRVIRSPALVRFWRRLPAVVRRRLTIGLRWATRRHLALKPAARLTPSPRAVRQVFARGADAIVSGHCHVLGREVHRAGDRECVHYELPPWSEGGVHLLLREGSFSFGRYEE